MTKRFVLVMLIAFVVPMVTPHAASAEQQNKLVFEIKTVADFLNGNQDTEDVTVETQAPTPPPVPPAPVAVKSVAKKTTYSTLPPKATGDARVFMQEPEIRAYVCPRLGNKCNTFIAILKAENGTHECTRDNRGLNKNGTVDIGLAQINWKPGNPWHTFEQLQDCKYNLDVALEMYSRRGFQPWYAFTKGAYLKHMPAVLASAKAIAEQEAAKPVEVVVVEPTTPEVAIVVTDNSQISN